MLEHSWHDLTVDDCFLALDSGMEGISSDEVLIRRERFGFNKLAEAENTSAFMRFISQYNDPLNYLLIAAELVALAIHPDQPGDAIFSFIVLTANAFL